MALSMALVESYHRPEADYSSTWGGYPYESKNFGQEGVLKNINFSIARKIFNGLSAGFGLNYVYGRFEKTVTEIDHIYNITDTDSLSHEFKGFFLNGGLIWNLTEKIAIAAVFRTPFVKKSDDKSLKRTYSPDTNTDIKIEVSGRSEYKQPLVVGLGVSFQISPELKVSSDLTFYNWSKYSIIYFGQEDELPRNFKDIIKIGAGIEHIVSADIFGQKISIPLRAGLSYDPQPMKEPGSSYFYYSFGTGLHWEKFHLDVGLLFGKEKGSGNSLSGRKAVLSLTLEL
jgi:long-subunit fatty acid transport protein